MSIQSIKDKLESLVETGKRAENDFKTRVESHGVLEAVSWFKGTPTKLYAAMYARNALKWINEQSTPEKGVADCEDSINKQIMHWYPEQSSHAISNAVQHEELEGLRVVLRALQDRIF